jgi:hypothetical protein
VENDNKFKFGIPVDLIKGKNSKGEERMLFKGRASTSHKDSQNESLDVNGMSLENFKIINWNHSKTPDCIIGEPTKSIIKDGNLDIEGELYSEMPQAISTYNLMKALKKRGKQLYFSVEGKVTKRGSEDKNNPLYNKILKSSITAVAITPHPINSNTFCELIEKGYTDNNDWTYDDETEELVKAAQAKKLIEEDEEEETEKAMTAEGGDGATSKEDVETKDDKKPIKNLESSQTKVFKKSDIYEKIYDLYPEIGIEKSKSVYSLIEKIATMSTEKKEITDETITKAFEILNLASDAIVKGKVDKDEDKSTASEKEKEDEDEEEEKEMVKKAKDKFNEFKKEGKDKEFIKKSLVKKGYGEKVIEKAMKEDSEEKEEKEKGISKAEITDIIKGELASFNEKFKAVNTILIAQKESSEELQKSFDSVVLENTELKKKVEDIYKTPGTRKSVNVTKSYSDKFEKSEGGEKAGRKFNLTSKTDRTNLKNHVMELSGINKGEDFDRGLANIAQELELTGTLSKASDIEKLLVHGLELVSE